MNHAKIVTPITRVQSEGMSYNQPTAAQNLTGRQRETAAKLQQQGKRSTRQINRGLQQGTDFRAAKTPVPKNLDYGRIAQTGTKTMKHISPASTSVNRLPEKS